MGAASTSPIRERASSSPLIAPNAATRRIARRRTSIKAALAPLKRTGDYRPSRLLRRSDSALLTSAAGQIEPSPRRHLLSKRLKSLESLHLVGALTKSEAPLLSFKRRRQPCQSPPS